MRASRVTISSARSGAATIRMCSPGWTTEPGGLGEPAVGRHVQRAPQVPGGEVGGVAGVQHHRAGVAGRPELVQAQRCRRAADVEQGVLAAVEHRVVHEVAGCRRLVLGDHRQELFGAHRCAGVVGGALLTELSSAIPPRASELPAPTAHRNVEIRNGRAVPFDKHGDRPNDSVSLDAGQA
jgi:hypothetical protein